MRSLRVLLQQIAGLLSKRPQQGLDEEIAFHLDMETEAQLRSGVAPAEARRRAILHLGGIEATKLAYHKQQSLPVVEAFGQDMTFAVRQLKRSPGFTLTVFAVLTLGIRACATIFAFVDATLLRPLPYPDPTRLVEVMGKTDLFPQNNLSYPDYFDWKRSTRVFDSLAAWTWTGYLLRISDKTTEVPATRVSANFFRTLGVSPFLGRDFLPGADAAGAAHTVILSYATWKQSFDGDRHVVGKIAVLNGLPFTIIGVLPETFHFAPRGRSQFWTPLQPDRDCERDRSCHNLNGVGRLKAGVTVRAAELDLRSIASRLEREYPNTNRGQGAEVRLLSESIVGPVRPSLFLLSGGAVLLMLISLVNVSGLLLARTESRPLKRPCVALSARHELAFTSSSQRRPHFLSS